MAVSRWSARFSRAATCALALFALSPLSALAQPATEVIVARVVEKTLSDQVEALGTLRANETVDVTAKVTEQIATLHFDDGQRVDAGAVLAELVRDEEQAQLDEAIAAREEAREQLDRFAGLAARRAATESEVSVRRREFQVADARVRAVEARVADRVIRAPFSGRVGLRMISAGATVEPGDAIARLIDDSVVKLDFDVPTAFLSALAPDVPIAARSRAFEGEVFEGVVRSIDSEIDPITRSVTVRATIPNPDGRLRPGLLMEVRLFVRERVALVAPEEALIPFGRDTFVLVAVGEDGAHRAERRQVVIGARRLGEVEILEGLSSGELVVTHGGIKVRPGQAITVRIAEEESRVRLSAPPRAL